MKVYFSGNVNGGYRAQNTLKVLGDAGIPYSFMPSTYFTPKIKNRYVRKLVNVFWSFLFVPVKLIQIAISSHVYVLPMNFSGGVLMEMTVAKCFGKKIIVDYYISLYDTTVNDRKLATESSFRGKLALFKDRYLMRMADRIVFLNRAESDYYQKVVGISIPLNKISIIPLCNDFKRELLFNKTANRDFFNVCWWGTYIPLHGLENLIKSFSHIKAERIKLYIFGDSDAKATPYLEVIEKLDLKDRVVVNNSFTFANGKLAPFLAENCDLAIGNFGSSEKAHTVLVNKLVDSLSLGIPCLTMETAATSELFEDGEGLVLVEPTPESIAQKIEECANDKLGLEVLAQAAKQKYLDVFSPDSFKIKLLELFQK